MERGKKRSAHRSTVVSNRCNIFQPAPLPTYRELRISFDIVSPHPSAPFAIHGIGSAGRIPYDRRQFFFFHFSVFTATLSRTLTCYIPATTRTGGSYSRENGTHSSLAMTSPVEGFVPCGKLVMCQKTIVGSLGGSGQ